MDLQTRAKLLSARMELDFETKGCDLGFLRGPAGKEKKWCTVTVIGRSVAWRHRPCPQGPEQQPVPSTLVHRDHGYVFYGSQKYGFVFI